MRGPAASCPGSLLTRGAAAPRWARLHPSLEVCKAGQDQPPAPGLLEGCCLLPSAPGQITESQNVWGWKGPLWVI